MLLLGSLGLFACSGYLCSKFEATFNKTSSNQEMFVKFSDLYCNFSCRMEVEVVCSALGHEFNRTLCGIDMYIPASVKKSLLERAELIEMPSWDCNDVARNNHVCDDAVLFFADDCDTF